MDANNSLKYPSVFSVSSGTLSCVVLLVLPLFLIMMIAYVSYTIPELSVQYVQIIFDLLTRNLGWMYLLYGTICLAVVTWVAFSPFGKIKLGAPNDKPDFSYFEWLSLLFCAGIGIGVTIWGMVESIHYIDNPPYQQMDPRTSSFVYELAHMIPFFHWGISAWAIYCIPTIPIAYFYYVKKTKLSFSSVFCKSLGMNEQGIISNIIDYLVIFSILGGVATSLGLTIPLLSFLMSDLFVITDSVYLKSGILLLLCVVFAVSTMLGVDKGIKKLSIFNSYLAIFFVLIVLFLGPMSFIFNISTNSIGLFMDNFFRLSFNLDPLKKTNWPQNWTVFYWAWWVAFTPMMAIFVTKVSKGRTIKQLIIAECIGGTLGCWLILAILGAYSIYLQYYGILDISAIIKTQGIHMACVEILHQLPMSKIVVSLYLLLAFVFSATTFDSSAYTLASISSMPSDEQKDPKIWLKVFWSIVLTIFAFSLLLLGIFKALQLSSLVFSIPMIPITIICFYFFIKKARQENKLYAIADTSTPFYSLKSTTSETTPKIKMNTEKPVVR